jgi:hypothetical protein
VFILFLFGNKYNIWCTMKLESKSFIQLDGSDGNDRSGCYTGKQRESVGSALDAAKDLRNGFLTPGKGTKLDVGMLNFWKLPM